MEHRFVSVCNAGQLPEAGQHVGRACRVRSGAGKYAEKQHGPRDPRRGGAARLADVEAAQCKSAERFVQALRALGQREGQRGLVRRRVARPRDERLAAQHQEARHADRALRPADARGVPVRRAARRARRAPASGRHAQLAHGSCRARAEAASGRRACRGAGSCLKGLQRCLAVRSRRSLCKRRACTSMR